MVGTETAGDGYDVYRDVFLVRSVSLYGFLRGGLRGGKGAFMSAFLVFTANTALLILLVLFIAYLVVVIGAADQWPE